MSDSKYLISARIPSEFATELKKMSEQSGRSITDCVTDAIAAYLGQEAPTTWGQRLELVEQQLAELSEGVAGLGNRLGKSKRG